MPKKTDRNDKNPDYLESPFFKCIEERVDRLGTKYPHRPKKALMSLIFWSCKQLLHSPASLLSPDVKQRPWWRRSVNPKGNAPRILFYLKGGVGDVVISSTFLKEFHKFIGGTHKFTLCTDQNSKITADIFRQCPWVEQIYNSREIPDYRGFDAVIAFCTVPRLIQRTPKSKQWTQLEELLKIYESFKVRTNRLCSLDPANVPVIVMYFLMNGHTRRSLPDIGHKLGMTDETRPVMVLDENAFDVFQRTDLANRSYVTIQRGVDASNKSNKSTRMWPQAYYNELIRMIHDEFPSLAVVQLGRAIPESDFEGVDVDLRGRTSFEELKVLLKRSALHIDGECGMVHLTHALGGRSAVFFGQTNVDFCGYPENINVKAKDACPLWCEWVTNDWQARCLRGFETPPCMEQLTPELFFDAIRGHLHAVANEQPITLSETTESTIPSGTTLFIGDFPDDAVTERVRPENNVLHFSMNLAADAVREKKARGVDADYADILNIPMKKESCDAVFCSQLQPLSAPALREVTRILKIGGVLQTKDGRSYIKQNF